MEALAAVPGIEKTDSRDESLFVRFRDEGDRLALDELYGRYHEKLFRYFFRHCSPYIDTAEDLTQEVFLKLMEKNRTFDAQAAFRPWLFGIARHTLINNMRRNRHHLEFAEMDELATAEPDPATVAIQEEARDSVMQMIEQLDPAHKEAAKMTIDGYIPQEAADMLKIPRWTFYSRMRKMRIALANLLQNPMLIS